jgi:tetratricopeptide (TPR) repeat protein
MNLANKRRSSARARAGARVMAVAAVAVAAAVAAAAADASARFSPEAGALVQRGMQALHNLDLVQADEAFTMVTVVASNHPAGYVCRAMTAWCRTMAEGPAAERRDAVAHLVDEAIACGQSGDAAQRDAWNDLFLGAAFVMRAGVQADAQDTAGALEWAKRGMGRLVRASHRPETAGDALVLVGAYQYFIDTTPWFARYFASLFVMPTDRAQGIETMTAGMADAQLLGPDARFLLAVASLWEDDTDRATDLIDGLARDFPRNHQIAVLRQSVLLREGKIAAAYLCATNCLAQIENDSRSYNWGLKADQHYAIGVIAAAAAEYQASAAHFAKAYALAGPKVRLAAWAILRQGTIHDLMGQRADACRCYLAARAIKTDTPLARNFADEFLGQPYAGETLE